MRYRAMLLLLCLPVMAAEKAAYDSNGRIVAMLSEAEDVGVATSFVAVLPGGKRVLLPGRSGGRGGSDGPGVTRQGQALAWSSQFTLPDGGRGRMEWKSDEDAAGLRYSAVLT